MAAMPREETLTDRLRAALDRGETEIHIPARDTVPFRGNRELHAILDDLPMATFDPLAAVDELPPATVTVFTLRWRRDWSALAVLKHR